MLVVQNAMKNTTYSPCLMRTYVHTSCGGEPLTQSTLLKWNQNNNLVLSLTESNSCLSNSKSCMLYVHHLQDVKKNFLYWKNAAIEHNPKSNDLFFKSHLYKQCWFLIESCKLSDKWNWFMLSLLQQFLSFGHRTINASVIPLCVCRLNWEALSDQIAGDTVYIANILQHLFLTSPLIIWHGIDIIEPGDIGNNAA